MPAMNHNTALEDFALDGRRFVITGASSGIGRAMAGFLAEAGAAVVLVARREDQLSDAVAALREQGHEADCIAGERCMFGFCQPATGCRVSGDCPVDQVCIDDLCLQGDKEMR